MENEKWSLSLVLGDEYRRGLFVGNKDELDGWVGEEEMFRSSWRSRGKYTTSSGMPIEETRVRAEKS